MGNHLTRATLIVAVAGFALLMNTVLAQEKGAERLMKLQRLNTPADVQKVEAGDRRRRTPNVTSALAAARRS